MGQEVSIDVLAARERCKKYRRRILDISQKGPAHVAPALSCLEIVDVIYHELKRPEDVFILSKGHGCLAQYVVLESLGVDTSNYGGHPDYGNPGIYASTGSLGHGLGLGVGMAYAEQLKGSDIDVYVVMSDGELQEGSTWEAVQMAGNLRLRNLILFVDLNDYGGMEQLSKTHRAVYPVGDKFRSFGWSCSDVNGHEALQLYDCGMVRSVLFPAVVICHTVKGKGVAIMEADPPNWHYKSPTKEQYEKALADLA